MNARPLDKNEWQQLDDLLRRAMGTRTARGLLLRNVNALVCKLHETAGRIGAAAEESVVAYLDDRMAQVRRRLVQEHLRTAGGPMYVSVPKDPDWRLRVLVLGEEPPGPLPTAQYLHHAEPPDGYDGAPWASLDEGERAAVWAEYMRAHDPEPATAGLEAQAERWQRFLQRLQLADALRLASEGRFHAWPECLSWPDSDAEEARRWAGVAHLPVEDGAPGPERPEILRDYPRKSRDTRELRSEHVLIGGGKGARTLDLYGVDDIRAVVDLRQRTVAASGEDKVMLNGAELDGERALSEGDTLRIGRYTLLIQRLESRGEPTSPQVFFSEARAYSAARGGKVLKATFAPSSADPRPDPSMLHNVVGFGMGLLGFAALALGLGKGKKGKR